MQQENEWLSTKEAAAALCINRSQLYRLKTAGTFRAGVHFYSKSGTKDYGQVVWHVPSVRKYLLDLTAAAYELAATS